MTIADYRKAAENGFADAMSQYALILKNTPKPSKQTQSEAKRFFQMALDAGVTDRHASALSHFRRVRTPSSSRRRQPGMALSH
jgi:TPR repeat protein